MEIQYDFDEEIKKLDEKIKDAEENLGDIEVRDAILAKAEFYEKVQQKNKAIDTYELALKISLGVSKKMEIVFAMLKLIMVDKNLEEIKKYIDRLRKFLEEGGDWEKKNKLKVYEGLYLVMIREFKKGAKLFQESISTFNSPEIISYNDLVLYTVLTSMISMSRSEIKEKILKNSEILQNIREIPNLKSFLDSFYKFDYKQFFISFANIIEMIQKDQYLSKHRKYFIREMRVVIYSQFLESYKTVTLESMANAFGVSVSFIDRELSELISSKRLNCKIDKVSGIVESERADKRNLLYQQTLKQGDFLLNRIQKLSRITDV